MRWIVWTIVGMFGCGAAIAGGSASAAGEQPLKIGYVDTGRVFRDSQRTKESEAALEQKNKQKQAELEGRVNELKKLRQSLELLNEQARETKSKELEEKTDEFRRLKSRTERELLRERDQVARTILQEIGRVVSEYAKANGYTLIVDQTALLYGEEAHDVTDEILKALNERHAAATAPKAR